LQQLAGDRSAAILAKASDLAKTQTAEAQAPSDWRKPFAPVSAETKLKRGSTRRASRPNRGTPRGGDHRAKRSADRPRGHRAREAARQLAANPAQTIPQNLVNNDQRSNSSASSKNAC